MRKAFHLTALTTLAFGTAMGTALAADLDPPLIIPEPMVIEDSGFYLRADAGVSQFANGSCIEHERAFTGDVGIGYRYSAQLRVDVTLGYSGKYKPACQTIKTWTAMLNGYIDLPTSTIVTPYLGAGVGWMRVKNNLGYKDDAVAIAGMAGVSIRATEKVDVDIGYRYTHAAIAGDPNWSDHALRVGLRLSVN